MILDVFEKVIASVHTKLVIYYFRYSPGDLNLLNIAKVILN